MRIIWGTKPSILGLDKSAALDSCRLDSYVHSNPLHAKKQTFFVHGSRSRISASIMYDNDYWMTTQQGHGAFWAATSIFTASVSKLTTSSVTPAPPRCSSSRSLRLMDDFLIATLTISSPYECPNVGGVSIRSRNGATSRKGYVVNGQMTKASSK